MKKFLAIVTVAASLLAFCNTPQPATSPDSTDTTMSASPVTTTMDTGTTQQRDTMRL